MARERTLGVLYWRVGHPGRMHAIFSGRHSKIYLPWMKLADSTTITLIGKVSYVIFYARFAIFVDKFIFMNMQATLPSSAWEPDFALKMRR